MIFSNYGSTKAIKWRLSRTRKRLDNRLYHKIPLSFGSCKKKPRNSAIFKTLSSFICKVRIRQWWASILGPGRKPLKVNLCFSHHGGRTEIASAALKQASLINHSSPIVVMSYKDWPKKLNCKLFQFCLQQILKDSGSLFPSFNWSFSLFWSSTTADLSSFPSTKAFPYFDLPSLMRGLYKFFFCKQPALKN